MLFGFDRFTGELLIFNESGQQTVAFIAVAVFIDRQIAVEDGFRRL